MHGRLCAAEDNNNTVPDLDYYNYVCMISILPVQDKNANIQYRTGTGVIIGDILCAREITKAHTTCVHEFKLKLLLR